MTNYLISFPSSAMVVAEEDFPHVVETSHAVVREMQAAGVLVFAGGLGGEHEPVRVSGDGSVIPGTYPQTREFDGGFTVIDVPTREEATMWAAKVAVACRCDQELRAFGEDSVDE